MAAFGDRVSAGDRPGVCHAFLMAVVGSIFYIEVHGLTAKREILGRSLTMKRGSIRYRIDLPETPNSFEFDRVGPTRVVQPNRDGYIQHSDPDPREYEPVVALVAGGGDLVDIRLIRIVSNVDTTLSIESFDADDPTCLAAHDRLFSDLWTGALQLARDFCLWTALELDQYWIEPSGKYPRVVNLVSLIDVSTQRSFLYARGVADTLTVIDQGAALTAASLQRIGEALGNPGSPEADEILLAEAWYLIRSLPALGSAPERATILAAVALEARVKRVLRFLEGDVKAASNQRRDDESPHQLFRRIVRICNELGGQRTLRKRVQSLFEARNRIMHEVGPLGRSSAKIHVESARQAFALLRQIEDQRRRNQLRSILLLLKRLEGKRKAIRSWGGEVRTPNQPQRRG